MKIHPESVKQSDAARSAVGNGSTHVQAGYLEQASKVETALYPCGLAAGTWVVTASGLRAIETLEPNDQVLTHKGRFRAVLANRPASTGGRLRHLTLAGFLPDRPALICSLTQRLKVLKAVHVACIRPTGPASRSVCLSKNGKHAACSRKAKVYASPCERLHTAARTTGEWLPAADVDRGDYVAVSFPKTEQASTISVLDYLDPGRFGVEHGLVGKLHKDTWRRYACRLHEQTAKIPEFLPLDESFAKFLGYYAAEGCVVGGNTVSLTFNSAETSYIEEVVWLGRKVFGLTGDVERAKAGNWTAVKLHSTILSKVLTQLIGTKGESMKVPQAVLESPVNVGKAFLLAAARGDGGKISRSQYGTTVSNLDLSYGLFQLALKCRALPLWRKAHKGVLAVLDAYSVILSLGMDNGLISDIGKGAFGAPPAPHDKALWKMEAMRFWGSDGLAYYRVNSVSEIVTASVCWDIVVEDDESALATGVVTYRD